MRTVLSTYPRLSAETANVLLSNLWSKTLNGGERRTFARSSPRRRNERWTGWAGREESRQEIAAAFEADEEDEDEEDGSDDDDDYEGSD